MIPSHSAGDWRLTTAERKRILLNNIYGVDIDSQAVEVTKLSLLLKVLEGENEGTLARQLRMFHERALPDLGKNIKCGNSLIGPDWNDSKQMDLLSGVDQTRINAFDWPAEFPTIIPRTPFPSRGEGQGGGGFDAVIGNPPYVRIQTLKESAPLEVEYYKRRYRAASKGNYDIYVVFVERGLELLNTRGRLGFILPHKFFNAKYGEPLRGLIVEGKHLAEVVHFGDKQVFQGATTYTCLMFLDKAGSASLGLTQVQDLDAWRGVGTAATGRIASKSISSGEWNFNVGRNAGLFERLLAMPVKLGDIAHLFVGLQTDADDVFILEEIRIAGPKVLCLSRATGREHWFEDAHLKHLLKGSLNVRRYALTNVSKRLVFPYRTVNGKSVLFETSNYEQKYPLTWQYLKENQSRLSFRKQNQLGAEWYGYVYKKNHVRFDSPKLVVPSIAMGSAFAADLGGEYYFVGSGGGGGGGYGITLEQDDRGTYLYLLGVLNSSLQSKLITQLSTPFRGGYYALNRQYIEQLPIRTIDFSNPTDKRRHDEMVALVERMLDLHKKLPAARTDQEKTALQRQVADTDQRIDRLVYDLYGLTEDEIAIVELTGGRG